MNKDYKYRYAHSDTCEITVEFITERQITYQLILKVKKPEIDIFIFDISLVNDNPTAQFSRDPKIEQTVNKIIKDLFKNQPNLNLLFCCFNLDGKGYKRKLLFERWFFNYNGNKLEKYYCDHFSDEVPDAFIITMKNNPLKLHLIDQFGSLGLIFKQT